MNGFTPFKVDHSSVRVSVGEPQHENKVTITGVMREPDVASWFDPMIEALHKQASERGLKEVVLDIRGLEYANADAWQCFVLWMRRIRQDPKARYNLRVLCESAYRWQSVGMSALRVFGAERLIVESGSNASARR